MRRSTLGRLLLDSALPEDMRGGDLALDKKGVATLFDDLARRHPGQYREVAKRLADVGRDVAQATGGFSFGLEHLSASPAGERVKDRLRGELEQLHRNPSLTPEAREHAVTDLLARYQKPLENAVFDESKAEGNPLAHQVENVGRGNKAGLKALRSGDLLYEDHHGRPIPIPVLNSYAKGLDPSEYFAASFGARKGVVDTKLATAQAGFLSKQMNQLTHRLVVTDHDHDDDVDRSDRGLPVDTHDPDNVGALLARPAGLHGRNTVLTAAKLAELKSHGVDRILVRSPTVGGPAEGGVLSRDVGVRERGVLAPRGDYVGLAAAQAIGEKVSQGMLSSKHAGGVAGQAASPSGFKLVDSLMQIPRVFPGGAAHAQHAGTVMSIADAPQGGKHISVGGKEHYAAHGQSPTVAVGDRVEPGDVLSDGIPNPAELVKYKGIGEGRRHFVRAFQDALAGSGMRAHRRNLELLARGAIDHVELDREVGPHVPGDILPYQALEAAYGARADAKERAPKEAIGRYLERPVLHHTIGTEIRPSMVKDLEHFGVHKVLVHDDPPPFRPVMIRAKSALEHDSDWLVRHLGSNLQRSTLEAAHRGRSSDTAGTSYVPALAERAHFGRSGPTRGWVSTHPRDGDGDGRTGDGSPGEKAADWDGYDWEAG